MEAAACVQKEKELGDGGKQGGWRGECSLSSLLKHSCLLCWSSPRDAPGATAAQPADDRVLAKATEIRELENAVTVESLELQEQESDRRELEETLEKLEKHKDKLVEQIKSTRQLCCEESQQILSLQAEEVKRESQVEEYERELQRARWRLRRLRDQVKLAKRKVEEAGERNIPLQDSIRQSYDEILQEEHMLCSLSGGAVTPDSQLAESTSPADTIEDEPLPVRPWGRSQSLPAYADLIMRASGSSFCNNLTDTREEAEDSSSSTPKIDISDTEEDTEDDKRANLEVISTPNPVQSSQLDFYQADPFVHCQTEHDLFNEEHFPQTDSSDVFAADPFKGTDPFAADILFPEVGVGAEEGLVNVGDEADTSLSCAENKASTGTQCFESEFPDEDSDIEISYSREDLDAIAVSATAADDVLGFKPIQSSSEDLGPEPSQGWRSQGQYSVESDPNGYELDLGAISPPSDIEELSMGSLAGEGAAEGAGLQQGLDSGLAHIVSELQTHPDVGSEPAMSEPDWTELDARHATEQALPREVTSCLGAEWDNTIEGEPQNPVAPQNALDSEKPLGRTNSEQNKELSFELSYEPPSQGSFDPYGFKLSPEHSSLNLLDPDEAELSPEPNDPDLSFDPEPSSSQPVFDPFAHQDVFDPYGFKLSPEAENQEVLDICGQDNQDEMDLCTYENQERVEPCNFSNQEVLEPCTHDNQEVPEPCSRNNQELLDFGSNGNQEVIESCSHENKEVLDLFGNEKQEFVKRWSDHNQEVLEDSCLSNMLLLGSHTHTPNKQRPKPSNYDNQEVLEPRSHGHQELLDFSSHTNQEVPDLGNQGNQELLDYCSNENQEILDLGSHDNQEVLDLWSKEVIPEANNNVCVPEQELSVNPTNTSTASDLASATVDLLGLELSNTGICMTNSSNTNTAAGPLNMAAGQDLATRNISASQDRAPFNLPAGQNLLEGDLGSVFGAGGYIGCPDVADDLEPLDSRRGNPVPEPLDSRRGNPVAEPVQPVPVRPVRPPRPSLKNKEKAQSQTQGIDLK